MLDDKALAELKDRCEDDIHARTRAINSANHQFAIMRTESAERREEEAQRAANLLAKRTEAMRVFFELEREQQFRRDQATVQLSDSEWLSRNPPPPP